ncbi:flavin reductase family protein [Clostridiales bacterium COT073_COT-073]|nr:flavin reductase family protein [Clostridiales bacterium COT073_COT-073]
MSLKKVEFNRYLKDAVEQLPKGAFLCTRDGDKENVMAVGWGAFGSMWGRPMAIVTVRPSRYSFEMIEKTGEFTLSIPFNQSQKDNINFCGSYSGREKNKFEEKSIIKGQGQTLDIPIIENCQLFYECRVITKQALSEEMLNQNIREMYYPHGNYHMVYYAEIIDSYVLEDDYLK